MLSSAALRTNGVRQWATLAHRAPSTPRLAVLRPWSSTASTASRTDLSQRKHDGFLLRRASLKQPNFPRGLSQRFFSSGDYPPHVLVGMPSLSPTMESGSIASWNVAEGDTFGAGQSLASIETDKATVDFEAQDDGVVAKLLVEAGPNDIACGKPIMITVEEGEDVTAFADYKVEEEAAAPAEEASAPPPSATPALEAAAPPPPPPPTPVAATAPVTTGRTTPGGRVVASPRAHKTAQELGIDIGQLAGTGTGPGGRILAADVQEWTPAAAVPEPSASVAAPAQAAMAAAAPVAGAGYADYALTESAQEAAARLMQSKRNVPHYYLTVDVGMDAVLQMRSSLNERLFEDEASLGVYEFVIKAAAKAMEAVPSANASWMEQVVRVYDSVDINVVLGSGDSLTTPILANVGSRGLQSISTDLHSAMSALEENDMSSVSQGVGTFTVANLGMYGIKSCAPIIREPQACALAIGALENRIVPNDDADSGEIYKESVVMTATLSCDHRVVDGAVGAQWLAAFKSHVEDPTTLLL